MAEGEEKEEEKIVAGAGGADEEKAIVVAGTGDKEEKAIVLAGAGDNEEKQKGVAGGGGGTGQIRCDARWFRPPPGFRFTPAVEELVIYYLLPKLQGREHVPNHSIIEANVYESHPDVLTEKHEKRGGGDSWYFLSPRARKYRNGRRPSRSTEDKLGRWKASTSSTQSNVKVAGDGKTKYSGCVLNYYEGKIKGETKSRWLMKEITIPEYENEKGGKNAGGDGNKDVLDQYVMCRIYVTSRPKRRQCKVEEEEAGPSGTQSEPAEESGQAGATSTAGRANLSEKQAGKRPAEEQLLGNATGTAHKQARHPNPDRLHLGPPAPLHAGNGMQGPFMAPMGQYGGRPMGCYARAPMPRPPMAYNNGQAPVAYNGQVHVSRQQTACNGQAVPLPQQQMAYNGQGPLPRQQAAYNRQAMRALSPPYRPGDSYGQIQNQAMMTRPPYPAGEAVNPPSSVVPGPAQTQTETDEMRLTRVIQQNLQEYHRIMQSAMHQQQQQQQQPTAFTQQQQQRQLMQHQQPVSTPEQQQPTAFTQQQQRQLMQHQQPASTPQQQQPTAFTPQQQQRQLMQHQQPASTPEQQQPTAFTQEQQEQHLRMMQFMQQQHWRMMQQPYNFGANGNYHHTGAMAPQFSLHNFHTSEAAQHYQNQRSRVLPSAMSGSAGASGVVSGAGGEVTGANWDCNNGGNMELVGSTTVGGSPSAADGDALPNMIRHSDRS